MKERRIELYTDLKEPPIFEFTTDEPISPGDPIIDSNSQDEYLVLQVQKSRSAEKIRVVDIKTLPLHQYSRTMH